MFYYPYYFISKEKYFADVKLFFINPTASLVRKGIWQAYTICD